MPSTSDTSANLAAAVRAERARRGWTQAELGERLGWTRARVADVESARRPVTVEDVLDLGDVYGLDPSVFIEAAQETPPRGA